MVGQNTMMGMIPRMLSGMKRKHHGLVILGLAFQWPNVTASKVNKAGEYITTEVLENTGAQKIILGKYDCAHYKKEFQQEGDQQVIYYLVTGAQNDIFICTFTIDKEQEALPINIRELTSVQNMIASIKII